MAIEKIEIDVDVKNAYKEIDELQEKANQLISTLREAEDIINSLSTITEISTSNKPTIRTD